MVPSQQREKTKRIDGRMRPKKSGVAFYDSPAFKRWAIDRMFLGLFLCTLGLLAAPSALAQTSTAPTGIHFNDSVPVDTRAFSEETIRRFQEDSDFNYGIRRKATLSWWDRLKYWLAQQWAKLFQYTYFGTIYDIVFYLFCFAVIAFAVLKLTGTNVSQLFRGKSDRGVMPGDSLEDNIYTIDFEQEIAQAERDGDYRRGIRLLYIYTLRQLADRQLIRWQPGKTNHDYQVELRGASLQAAFEPLSYYYEYAWYGNFPVDEAMYRRVEQLFQHVASSSQAAV